MEKQDLAGVKDAVICENPPFGKVRVKELTKEQILRLAKEWGFIPGNATPFYYSRDNLIRLLELVEEGKLKRRDCVSIAYELNEEKQ